MTTLDELFSSEAGLRVQQAAYRKGLLEAMAHKVASDLKEGSTRREIGVPVLSGFIKGIIPAGKGQAEKADSAANAMIDSILQGMGVTEGVAADVTGEQAQAQGEAPEAQPEAKPEDTSEQAQGSRSKHKAA